VDTITHLGAGGWAFSDDEHPLLVEAWCEGRLIGTTYAKQPRDDVAAAFPNSRNSRDSGYWIDFDLTAVPGTELILNVYLKVPRSNGAESLQIGEGRIVTSINYQRCIEAARSTHLVGPVPREIMSLINGLWTNLSMTEEAIAEKVLLLLSSPRARTLPFMAQYGRFLTEIWTHFQFVERYFPQCNEDRSPSDKDFFCKVNSPAELMSIAHQLYVLRSYGLIGDFAEFGCFKGYSTSMLSFACAHLGIKMHVFDSFQGLPPSESVQYRPGDFSSGVDEVRQNVECFGAASSVAFHPGYFSNSLRDFCPPPLMCLWMDVDLESSAQDVMTIADRIDARGTVFSHECTPHNFEQDRIIANRSADSVIPPILDRFCAMNAPLVGRFVSGNTGAFWRRDLGIPVLSNRVLAAFLDAA